MLPMRDEQQANGIQMAEFRNKVNLSSKFFLLSNQSCLFLLSQKGSMGTGPVWADMRLFFLSLKIILNLSSLAGSLSEIFLLVMICRLHMEFSFTGDLVTKLQNIFTFLDANSIS